jgi:hypothetical protein
MLVVLGGANGLDAPWPDRFANGLAGAAPPTAGCDANIDFGLASGEVCMLSSAGEAVCCPNIAGLVGVLVLCWAPNPGKD